MTQRGDLTQMRRWQAEVARDPGSPAFVPLADLYRREGRAEVARRLCTRGLQRQPRLVEGHVLLGRLFREAGELEQAFDEWDIALRLDPEHRAARRALAYLCLERRDWAAAARHLEDAAAADPLDPRLRSALALARRQLESGARAPGAAADPATLLAPPLGLLVREARLRTALVMETSGRILLQHGAAGDLAALASLAAGVHSASRALARLLGEPGFQQLHQGEGDHQLLIAPVYPPGTELLLVAIFGTDANLGLVRVRAREFAASLAEMPDWPARRGPDARAFEADLAAGLGTAAPPAPRR